MMLCTKGVTRASQNVLPRARAASSSGRKRLAKPCSCCSARFSLQQPPGSTSCQGLESSRGEHSRAASLLCPLPRHQGSLAPPAPTGQGGPLPVPGPCPQWPWGPAAPAKWGLCRGCGHEILLCLADLCHVRMCWPWEGPASLFGGLVQLKPRGDPKVALAIQDLMARKKGPSHPSGTPSCSCPSPAVPSQAASRVPPGPGTPGRRWNGQDTTHLPKSCSSCPRSRQISWLQAWARALQDRNVLRHSCSLKTGHRVGLGPSTSMPRTRVSMPL